MVASESRRLKRAHIPVEVCALLEEPPIILITLIAAIRVIGVIGSAANAQVGVQLMLKWECS